jgi:predicted phage terminase large subunit-like protein
MALAQDHNDYIEHAAEQAWAYNIADFAQHFSNGTWIPYPWLEYMLEEIQEEVLTATAHMVINAPPRHGKSESLSLWLPIWYLWWYPGNRIILASYGDSVASRWGRRVRDTILSIPELNARIGINPKKMAAREWETIHGGGMKTCGVGGPITSYGAELILIDDPHKDWAEAQSATIRGRIIDWWEATLESRLEPPNGAGGVVLLQTRWHQRDLSGYLLEDFPDVWKNIRLPALAEENDPLGRDVDEALCPERYSAKMLMGWRKSKPEAFAGLYQQRPTPLEGGIIKRSWIKHYDDLPAKPIDVVISWDMTFKEHGSSYVVGQVWFQHGANFYLLHQERGRWDFAQTLKKTLALHKHCLEYYETVREVLIEEAANGHAIISSLRDQVAGVIGVRATKSKIERVHNTGPLFEAGNVYFPNRAIAPWIMEFVEELVTFPNATNDDQVDACTQMLNRHRATMTNPMDLTNDLLSGKSPWSL